MISGTTGAPKGALGTHRNLATNIFSSGYNAACAVLRRGEELPDPVPKVTLNVIPLFHVTACSAGLMGNIAAGNTMIYMRKWDPVKAFEIIEREKVNATGGVPTIAWQLLEHPERKNYDLSSLEAKIDMEPAPEPIVFDTVLQMGNGEFGVKES